MSHLGLKAGSLTPAGPQEPPAPAQSLLHPDPTSKQAWGSPGQPLPSPQFPPPASSSIPKEALGGKTWLDLDFKCPVPCGADVTLLVCFKDVSYS